MMKKIVIFCSVMMLSLLLAACGNTSKKEESVPPVENNTGETTPKPEVEETPKETPKEPVQSNNDAQANMQKQLDELDFVEFKLEVEYANQTEYEADLDKDDDNGLIEADIKDTINNVNLYGEEAFNDLIPKLKALPITQQTTKDEAILEALKAFSLKDDYRKFEIEIQFKDGSKIEYEDRK